MSDKPSLWVEIPLTQGQAAKVSHEFAAVLSRSRWHALWDPCTRSYRAKRTVWNGNGYETFFLHREAVELRLGRKLLYAEKVDHRNHDTLDCTDGNLRVATNAQNCQNARLRRDSTSGFKGVNWHKASGRWRARIGTNGSVPLGSFDTAEEAAMAYNAAAREMFGEFALLNELPEAG